MWGVDLGACSGLAGSQPSYESCCSDAEDSETAQHGAMFLELKGSCVIEPKIQRGRQTREPEGSGGESRSWSGGPSVRRSGTSASLCSWSHWQLCRKGWGALYVRLSAWRVGHQHG